MEEYFHCFKFRAINKYLIASLVKPALFFAKPKTLNDPFDCHINLSKLLNNAFLAANKSQKEVLTLFIKNINFFEEIESKLANVGVFSATSDIGETLLWSHYADEHKGVCIGYRIPVSKYISEGRLLGSSKVNYQVNLTAQVLSIIPNEISNETILEFNNELVKLYLTTKSPAWSYEKEKRILSNQTGLLDIPKKFIEKVCFGLQTSEEDISLVKNIAEKFCDCTDFRRMVRDHTDYGFSPIPL